jgi:hypothetical protein
MSQFIQGLSHSDELQNEIFVNLNGIQIETLEERFNKAFKKELFKYECIVAFVELDSGLFNLLQLL